MSQKTAEEIRASLAQPFTPEDLEWRLQHVSVEKPYGLAVPYVTNRAIQNRLDDVVGPDNWYNDYKPWHGTDKREAQLCGISIYFEEKKRWITKWDGAEDSDIEPIKGGLSDSMKRAAVQWGIGRILYEMDAVFVDVEQRGKTWYIAKKEQSKLDNAYLELLKKKGLSLVPTKDTPSENVSRESKPQEKIVGQKSKLSVKQTAPKQVKEPNPVFAVPDISTEDPIYTVISPKVQTGINGASTRMVLEGPDGKRVNVFMRGAHPELTDGLAVTDVRLVMKTQDTVVFYVLEGYRAVSSQSRDNEEGEAA